MIREYRRDCGKYLMGDLAKAVYLLPRETTKINYTIDDFDGKVNSIIATQCIRMETVQTKLEVTENTGQRLAFDSTVTATMRENWGETWVVLLNRLKHLDCYIVIEDNSGDQYLQCPEFTSQMTYTYNFNNASDSGHNAEIKFKVSSNNPTLILENKVLGTERIDYDCAYQDGGITGLWLTPYNYAFIDNDNDGKFTTITCTGGEALHQVDFNNQSFQFRQQYDGRQYQERLQFTIPFDGYMNYWHYNLVEFMQNRYAIAFKTSQGNYIAAGFEFGFLPSYTIETTDNPDDINTITVVLTHAGQSSIFYCSDREPTFIDSTTDIFVPVTQAIKDPVTGRNLPYWDCISKSEACYTLIQMCTETMIPTDRYMCLEGYETTYQNLNIVGTYTKDYDFGFPLIFENYDCSYKDNCELEYMPKTVYIFAYAGQSFTTKILGPCPWTLNNIPDWIDCNVTEGQGGIEYSVTFTCKIEGTETPVTAAAFIQTFDNVGLIQFICQKESDWYSPYVHNITAKGQTVVVNVFESPDDYEVCEIPEGLTYRKVYVTKRLEIAVPENTDPNNAVQYLVKLCSPYHEDGYVVISQDNIYYQWREVVGEYLCKNGSSYKKLRRYKGYSPDDITIYTGEQRTGELLVANDERCATRGVTGDDGYMYEWMEGYTSCQGKDLYEASRKRESFDGGITWNWTDEYELGNLIETGSGECASVSSEKQYKMIIDEANYVCDGYTSYYMEYQWYSYDGEKWFKDVDFPGQKSSKVRKTNDTACGYPIDDPSGNTQWVVADGYVCLGGDKYSRLRQQISTDGGITWVDTDIYKANQLIQEQSPDCTGVTPTYGWVETTKKVCNGTTSYKALRYAYTYDNVTWYVVEPAEYMQSSTVIKENDPECGYVDGAVYRWNYETGEYLCNDGNKYKRNDYEVSTDGGNTWTKTGTSSIGSLIESDSDDCQNVSVQYEYRLGNDYECNGCDSYYMLHRWESQDGGQTWYESDPQVTSMSSSIRLANDPNCGCEQPSEPQYHYIQTTSVMCVGYDEYWVEKQQVSYDSGLTWADVSPAVTKQGSLKKTNSTTCGWTETVIYDWRIDRTRWTCNGVNSYYLNVRYESLDNGQTWNPSFPEVTLISDTVHLENDSECIDTPETEYRWIIDGDNYICE